MREHITYEAIKRMKEWAKTRALKPIKAEDGGYYYELEMGDLSKLDLTGGNNTSKDCDIGKKHIMTMHLNRGTKPYNLAVKTGGWPMQKEGVVYLGDYEISMDDFAIMVDYVLTSVNIEDENDPRVQMVRSIKAMKLVEGYPCMANGEQLKTKRYTTWVPPVRRG